MRERPRGEGRGHGGFPNASGRWSPSQGAGRLGHRAAPGSLCGEEAVQGIKPAAGTQPAPHSFPSVPGFTAPASSPPFPSAGDAPAKASPSPRPPLRDSSLLDSLSLGLSRTPQPLTPCRVILVTGTAAGIEGECGEGPVRPGGWGMGGRRGRSSSFQPTAPGVFYKEAWRFLIADLKAVRGDASWSSGSSPLL